MGNVREDEEPKKAHDANLIRSKKPAQNKKERRESLGKVIALWGNYDIGRIERVDEDDCHGWKMWRWKKV